MMVTRQKPTLAALTTLTMLFTIASNPKIAVPGLLSRGALRPGRTAY